MKRSFILFIVLYLWVISSCTHKHYHYTLGHKPGIYYCFRDDICRTPIEWCKFNVASRKKYWVVVTLVPVNIEVTNQKGKKVIYTTETFIKGLEYCFFKKILKKGVKQMTIKDVLI